MRGIDTWRNRLAVRVAGGVVRLLATREYQRTAEGLWRLGLVHMNVCVPRSGGGGGGTEGSWRGNARAYIARGRVRIAVRETPHDTSVVEAVVEAELDRADALALGMDLSVLAVRAGARADGREPYAG